jgi:hypothetical protein
MKRWKKRYEESSRNEMWKEEAREKNEEGGGEMNGHITF